MDTIDKKSSIERLGLSSRSYNALRRADIHTVGDLLDYPRHELSLLKHIGAKASAEILDAIEALERPEASSLAAAEHESFDHTANEAFVERGSEVSLEERLEAIVAQRERLNLALDIQKEQRNLPRYHEIIQMPGFELNLHEVAVEVADNISAIVPVRRDDLYQQVVVYLETLAKSDRSPAYEDKSGKPLLRNLGRIPLLRSSIKRLILAVLLRYPYGASLEDIVEDVPLPMSDERFIRECISELRLTKRIIVTHEGRFRVNFSSVTDFVRSMQNVKHKAILMGRLEGKSLDEVGLELGLTRERIRQLQNKCFTQAPPFREDVYHLVFERYNISKQDFMLGFDEDESVYNYLNIRYKRGKQDVSELIHDQHVPKRFREAGQRIASQYYIHVDGEDVIASRSAIVNYLLRTAVTDSMHSSEFTAIYDSFVERLGLDVNPKIHGLDRAYFNRLANDRQVLWNHGNRLRYYDIDARDYSDLFAGISLQRFKNVEISAKLLFDEQPALMEAYDIRDEYELHNLLKKICSEGPFSHVIFRRMPHIHFGQVDRDKQVYDLLTLSAPISQVDFIELYAKRYGIHQQTILTNYLAGIDAYLYDGIYRFDIKPMPEEKLALLRSHLTEDFYRSYAVEEIFRALFPNEDSTQLNAYLYKLIGYNSYSDYVIRDSYPTASEYFQHLLTRSDFIDSDDFSPELRQLNSYIVELYRLRSSLDIIEYEPGKYVNRSYLERHGIGAQELKEFCDWVYETEGTEYFTIYSFMRHFADQRPVHWKLDERFTDYFYASVLITDSERFAYRRLGGQRIIRKSGRKFQMLDFIQAILKEHKLMQPSAETIHELLEEEYDVHVPVKTLPDYSTR